MTGLGDRERPRVDVHSFIQLYRGGPSITQMLFQSRHPTSSTCITSQLALC
jgi:hypothetical protein